MSSKSLTAEQNSRVRELVRKLETNAGSLTELARQLRVSQPLLSDVISGKKGAGGKLLSGLSKLAPAEVTAILGAIGAPVVASVISNAATTESTPGIPDEISETVIAELTDLGFPYKSVRAAIGAVVIYEKTRGLKPDALESSELTKLARGLLEQSVGKRTMLDARDEVIGKAQEFTQGRPRLSKRRARK